MPTPLLLARFIEQTNLMCIDMLNVAFITVVRYEFIHLHCKKPDVINQTSMIGIPECTVPHLHI